MEKDETEFYVRKSGLINPHCKPCVKAETAARRAVNPEKNAADAKAWREKNPEQFAASRAAWATANPELVKGYARKKRKKYAARGAAYRAKHRAKTLRATPSWADSQAIERIYMNARRLTVETGILHHVDHEVPLQGELVSGLHVEFNLRAIPATENLKKNNSFVVA